MTRTIQIAAIVAVGVALGTAVALADREPAPTVPVAAAGSAPVQRVPVTPVGPVRIVARADDPHHGAPWALRRFVVRDRRRNGKVYVYPCVQLGRLDGSRFGWIAPGQPFRPAPFDLADVPSLCGEKFRKGVPNLTTAALTTDAARGAPEPSVTVVWGALPPDAAQARLKDGTTLRAGPAGAVLAVLAGRPVGEPRLAGTLRTRSGASRSFADPRAAFPGARSRAGDVRLAVRQPDPAGGPAWGILVGRDRGGRLCIAIPGRVVGDRIASVQPRLGLATPDPFLAAPQCPTHLVPTAAHPIRADVAIYEVHDEDPSATVQLRRLNERTAIYARTTPDVRAVTLTTSRDTRTLIPDPRTHLVLAVYDGTFPRDSMRLTAHLRSGATATIVQSTG